MMMDAQAPRRSLAAPLRRCLRMARVALGLGCAAFGGLAVGADAAALDAVAPPPASAPALAPVKQPGFPSHRFKVIGGLGGRVYQHYEEPFWTKELPQLSGGRLTAEISASTNLALSYQEMLRLARLGSAPIVNLPLPSLAGEDVEAEGGDLAGLSPDAATARRAMEAYRDRLAKMFRQRHGLELVATLVYPAQVLICAQPVAGLHDLKGRLIRTSSATQADLVEGLGAQAITLPFRGLTQAMRVKTADCAITGAVNAYLIKLHDVTSHVLDLPINWGPSAYLVNAAYWDALDPPTRNLLRERLNALADRVWAAIEEESRSGVACLTGHGPCPDGGSAHLTLVRPSDADRATLRRLLVTQSAPRWAQRCGAECAIAWNDTVGAALGLTTTAQ